MQVSLFTTAGCHLCEQAYALLKQVSTAYPLEIVCVEIGDDDKLLEQYGLRIPVVQTVAGSELNWPFTELELNQFISNKINH